MTSSQSTPDLMYLLLQQRIQHHHSLDKPTTTRTADPLLPSPRVEPVAEMEFSSPRYTHYQAQPQPLPYPPVKDHPAFAQPTPPQGYVPLGQAYAFPSSSSSASSATGTIPPHNLQHAHMSVGSHAGDFQLFGQPPQHQQQQALGQQQLPHQFAAQPFANYRPVPAQSFAQGANTAPLPSYGQSSYPISIPSSASSTSSHADNDYPPLPDLVADEGASPASFSPPSPRFAPRARPALYRGGQGSSGEGTYRVDRAASVPIPDAPRPMRRKTQESRDWPSFYSSGSSSTSSSMSSSAYLPTPQLGNQGLLPPPQGGYVDEPASFDTPTAAAHANPFDAANLVLSPAPQYSFYQQPPAPPHTDHPLLASEQSDLLRRVQRDLVDVDLSSIKGPLRALALSGGEREATPLAHHDSQGRASAPPAVTPGPPMSQQQQPSQQQHATASPSTVLRSPAAATVAEDALSAGTVSPQEAFLDYDEVDSRLHDPHDPLYSVGRDREFGVGVGASLFAPLPAVAAARGAQSPATTAPFAPSPLRERSTTPTAASVAGPLSPKMASPSAPSSHAHHGHGHAARRGPHPFSVPQNAVTWAARRSQSGSHLVGGVVDGDADDDDDDFGSQDPEDEEESDASEAERRRLDAVRKQAGLGAGFGAFDKRDVDLKPALSKPPATSHTRVQPILPKPAPSDEERSRYGLDNVGKPLFGVAPSLKNEGKAARAAYAPPPPSSSAGSTAAPVAQFAPPPPSGVSAFHTELQKQKAQLSQAPGAAAGSGTNTPRRAAAASALAGLNAHPELYADGSDAGSAAPSPPPSSAARPARQRKRSRALRAIYGELSDEAGADAAAADDDDDGDESDASYHSSASSFGGATGGGGSARQGGPAPKRRRRAPAAGSAQGARTSGGGGGGGGTATGSGSIRCDHLNSDGTTCGVIFRRPYDLARHRETIHNESLGGEKLKSVKEWRCHECDGTFSRKDALIRHCRIRGHKAG
ncbi:uncharacterized protein RHOBADRAFT_52749 [Rhodotorula graminis WP1]|uniref:C2H2-type domain-containing protein n=1 Tax=Rhodotorula graminis (strain WP1) TaxID=578459 RepID=A0A194S5C4_RHOGW|nr:uncharacterized protein RHOBADRAFT_52749 [Rhodotorula graminis WP1]KPV75715.1 hypothetical protein RHOBADRAFT_52749 [Rhodotorula graminis WP1]